MSSLRLMKVWAIISSAIEVRSCGTARLRMIDRAIFTETAGIVAICSAISSAVASSASFFARD